MQNIVLLHNGDIPKKLVESLNRLGLWPKLVDLNMHSNLEESVYLFLFYISTVYVDEYVDSFLSLKNKFPNSSFFVLDRHFKFNHKMLFASVGADLYFYYPLNVNDLVKYINFYLAKHKAVSGEVIYKDIILNINKRTVTRGEITSTLRNKEFELLKYFMAHPGEIISKTKIIEEIWDMNASTDTRTVEAHVSYLRAKIDSGFEEKRLQTIYCVGYKFE